MDMSEKKKETMWVFADSDNLPLFGQFVSCEMEISKSGASQFPVITLDSAGIKIKLSKWRVDTADCVKKYGNDSNDWKGKLFQVSREKEKLHLRPIEETLS